MAYCIGGIPKWKEVYTFSQRYLVCCVFYTLFCHIALLVFSMALFWFAQSWLHLLYFNLYIHLYIILTFLTMFSILYKQDLQSFIWWQGTQKLFQFSTLQGGSSKWYYCFLLFFLKEIYRIYGVLVNSFLSCSWTLFWAACRSWTACAFFLWPMLHYCPCCLWVLLDQKLWYRGKKNFSTVNK